MRNVEQLADNSRERSINFNTSRSNVSHEEASYTKLGQDLSLRVVVCKRILNFVPYFIDEDYIKTHKPLKSSSSHQPPVTCIPLSQQPPTTEDSLRPPSASSCTTRSLPSSPRKSLQVHTSTDSDMFGSGALSSSAANSLRSQITSLAHSYGPTVYHCTGSLESRRKEIVQQELKQKHQYKQAKDEVKDRQQVLEEIFRASSKYLEDHQRLSKENEAKFRNDEALRYKDIAKQLEAVEQLETRKKHLVRYIQEKQHEKLLMDMERVEPVGQSCSEESVVSAISMVKQVCQSVRSVSEPRLGADADGRKPDGRLSRNAEREGKLRRAVSPSPSEIKSKSFMHRLKPSAIAEQVTARLYPAGLSKKSKPKRSRTTSPLPKQLIDEDKRKERSRSVPVLTDRQNTLGANADQSKDIILGDAAESMESSARYNCMQLGPISRQHQHMYDDRGGDISYDSKSLSHIPSTSTERLLYNKRVGSPVQMRKTNGSESHRRSSDLKLSKQKSPFSRKRQHFLGTSQTDLRSRESSMHDMVAKRREFFGVDVQNMGSYNAQLHYITSSPSGNVEQTSQYKSDIIDDNSSVMSLGDSASCEKFAGYRGPIGFSRLSSDDGDVSRMCRSASGVESRSSRSYSKNPVFQRSASRESTRSDVSRNSVSSRDSSCTGSSTRESGTREWRASSVGDSSTCSSRSHQSKKMTHNHPGRRDNAFSDYMPTDQIQKRCKPDECGVSSVTSSYDGGGDAISLRLESKSDDGGRLSVEPTHQLFAQSLRGGIIGRENTFDPCTRFNRARAEVSDDSSSLPDKVPHFCRSTPDANRCSEGYYSDNGHSSCFSLNHHDPCVTQPLLSTLPHSENRYDDMEPMVYSDDSLDDDTAPTYSAASSSSASNMFTYTLMSSDTEQNDQEKTSDPDHSINLTRSNLQDVELFSDDSLDHILEIVDNMELTVMPQSSHKASFRDNKLSDVEENDPKSESSEEELSHIRSESLYGEKYIEDFTITASTNNKYPNGIDLGCSISTGFDEFMFRDKTHPEDHESIVDEQIVPDVVDTQYIEDDVSCLYPQPSDYPQEDVIHDKYINITFDSLDTTSDNPHHTNLSMDSLDRTVSPPKSRTHNLSCYSHHNPISSTPRRTTSITPYVDGIDLTTVSSPSDDGYGKSISGHMVDSTSLSDDTGYGRSISILSTDGEVDVDGPFLSMDSLDINSSCSPRHPDVSR